jgi:hypothetical protein
MGLTIGKSKLSTADRIDFFKTLNGWMQAGAGRTSLSEAVKNTVEAYSHEEYASLAGVMHTIHREVESGQTMFYAALAQSDLGFKEQELAVIEAAERSSQLTSGCAMPSASGNTEGGRSKLMGQVYGKISHILRLPCLSCGIAWTCLQLVGPWLQKRPWFVATFRSGQHWFLLSMKVDFFPNSACRAWVWQVRL